MKIVLLSFGNVEYTIALCNKLSDFKDLEIYLIVAKIEIKSFSATTQSEYSS